MAWVHVHVARQCQRVVGHQRRSDGVRVDRQQWPEWLPEQRDYHRTHRNHGRVLLVQPRVRLGWKPEHHAVRNAHRPWRNQCKRWAFRNHRHVLWSSSGQQRQRRSSQLRQRRKLRMALRVRRRVRTSHIIRPPKHQPRCVSVCRRPDDQQSRLGQHRLLFERTVQPEQQPYPACGQLQQLRPSADWWKSHGKAVDQQHWSVERRSSSAYSWKRWGWTDSGATHLGQECCEQQRRPSLAQLSELQWTRSDW